ERGLLECMVVVANTGDASLTNVVVVSELSSPYVVAEIARMDPGGSFSFSFSFSSPLVTCEITNTVTAVGLTPCGEPVAGASTVVCEIAGAPAILSVLTQQMNVPEGVRMDAAALVFGIPPFQYEGRLAGGERGQRT